MAIRIEPQATPKARLPEEMLFWHGLDELDELALYSSR
jgi:hypothetical protein